MKNKFLPVHAFALAFLVLQVACQKENNQQPITNVNRPHTATIYLTDHATPVFDSVFIDLQRLDINVENDSTHQENWITLSIHPGVYNILRFRNGLDTLFATGNLPTARLKKLRLVLGTRNSVMKNGQSFPLRVKDEDREVMLEMDATHFDITPSGTIRFWIDFDAGNSIQVDNSGSGNNNGYRLRSHINLFCGSKSGRIEGRVGPNAADAIVKAINGTDTATAIPDDHDGEFKIVGLHAGTYQLLFDGQNGYQDTLVQQIIVRNGEDTHVPAVLLH